MRDANTVGSTGFLPGVAALAEPLAETEFKRMAMKFIIEIDVPDAAPRPDMNVMGAIDNLRSHIGDNFIYRRPLPDTGEMATSHGKLTWRVER